MENPAFDQGITHVGPHREQHRLDRRPAYVRQLDAECRAAKAELEAIENGLRELRIYLLAPKFSTNRYVNVDDVLLRMEEIRSAGLQARGES